jgi:hypothetical protein
MKMTGPITPQGLIAVDDDIVRTWVYAVDDPRGPEYGWREHKITLCVTRGDWGDMDDDNEFYFGLHPEQTVESAHRLLALAAIFAESEPCI